MAVRLDLTHGARGARRRRARRLARLGAAALLAVLVWRQGPAAAACALEVPRRLAAWLAPAFTARLEALEQENQALHNQLAALLPLEQENAALRALVNSGRAAPGVWMPARVTARAPGQLTLYCADARPAAGAAVVDRRGRYAGCVARAEGDTVVVTLPGEPACLAGQAVGVLQAGTDGWSLAGLPAAAAQGLDAGTPVTTLDGAWVGTLAAAPETEPGGLTARAPLAGTADRWDALYFVAAGG